MRGTKSGDHLRRRGLAVNQSVFLERHLLDTECLTNYNIVMRKIEFAVGESYHIYNRGVRKKILFIDERDYTRFLFLLIYFQSPILFFNLGRYVTNFVKHSVFNIPAKTITKIIAKRLVKLHAFALMPNHFHLILEAAAEKGVSTYLHRVLNAYGKYFNTKYKESGHVFQGPFRAVPIGDNNQLLHTSAYVHRNCRELNGWRNQEHRYPWSSHQDYVSQNRWNELLSTDLILGQFKNQKEYRDFVDSSPAKTVDDPNFC